MSLKIAVSAGEVSGDRHAAGLFSSLLKNDPEVEVRGMGGSSLRAAGVDTVVDSEKSASVMGLTEVFSGLGGILSALGRMKGLLKNWKPDLLVIVDYPDFNLRLAGYAKKLSIPVVYYIPPKVWAWRGYRVKQIEKLVDLVIVIFPFEKEFYEQRGFNRVVYVGHPFVDRIAPSSKNTAFYTRKDTFLESVGINPNKPVVALLPGSRKAEIVRHLKTAVNGVMLARKWHPEIQVLIPIPETISKDYCRKFLPEDAVDALWLKFTNGRSLEVLQFSSMGLIKSGTANLEAAMADLPFCMYYVFSPFSALVGRIVKKLGVFKIDQFSLVNIIRPGTVSEFIQDDFTPENVASEIENLLFNPEARKEIRKGLESVRERLKYQGREGGRTSKETSYDRAAELVLELAASAGSGRKRVYKRIWNYLKPYRFPFAAALVCMVGFGASDGAVPLFVKYALDEVFTNKREALLYVLPVALLAFTVLRALLDFGQQYIMSYVGHSIVKDFRNELNRKLLSLSPDFFIAHSSANLLSRITSDVQLIKVLLTTAVASVLRDSIRVVALAAAALYLDPLLALIALVVLPVGGVPIYYFGRRMRNLSRRGQDAIGKLSSLLQESILGHRVVKAFGRERFERARFENNNESLTRVFLKSEKVKALTGPVNEVLASLAICAVILYGGFTVIGGSRTQGDFIAFLISVFLMYDPFKKLSRVNSALQQGIAGAERFFEILDSVPTIQDPKNPSKLGAENTIELKDISFSYGGEGSKPVLSGVNLTVTKGSTVALVGPSGAGKSTLVDLIPRFIDPDRGVVKIGGVDVSSVRLSELRARIAVVSQHTFLFNDTIFNNIAYGRDGASYDEVIAAAKTAYAYDFITRLKDGFDTVVGEGGFSLSGGERQRIAIARAVLKDAPILILDEATASLDNQSEREVQRALDALKSNRTCLVVAHRLSTVRNADLITVMKEGKIIEKGTHDSLLEASGEYSRLYSLQFATAAAETGPRLGSRAVV